MVWGRAGLALGSGGLSAVCGLLVVVGRCVVVFFQWCLVSVYALWLASE